MVDWDLRSRCGWKEESQIAASPQPKVSKLKGWHNQKQSQINSQKRNHYFVDNTEGLDWEGRIKPLNLFGGKGIGPFPSNIKYWKWISRWSSKRYILWFYKRSTEKFFDPILRWKSTNFFMIDFSRTNWIFGWFSFDWDWVYDCQEAQCRLRHQVSDRATDWSNGQGDGLNAYPSSQSIPADQFSQTIRKRR
jgi:hypothetical protein